LELKTLQIFTAVIVIFLSLGILGMAQAGPPLQKCAIQPPGPTEFTSQRLPQPECGLELTCTDKPVLLGNPQGVCFRATCPGIWGLIHTRADQASFRRRFFTYRHYAFRGHWDLKDQGVIEAGPAPLRELFLVLPEDLIEFKLAEPDCHARVEIRKLGYIKTGNLCELQEWLAYNSSMEKAGLNDKDRIEGRASFSGCLIGAGWLDWVRSATTVRLRNMGRTIGLPVSGY
jgi:hypothetical protein